MLYIRSNKDDYDFFEQLKNKYPNISVSTSMSIDGNSQLVEVFIELTPVILSSLTIIVHEILSYMNDKRKNEKDKQSEITIEKKNKKGAYKVIVKSSDVDDIDKALEKTIKQIKKL